ncbi:uncharacterized protein LOC131860140 [Cryptomeria japonica]|uniref:uncharacterized protein LOC131860140 n=1 Tax=Cryptomeria japonica TaxID=3369 RepID=UPI0027DA2FED|nr:uncharacterized protein LOC131860140 [Cryptomeria japonica]
MDLAFCGIVGRYIVVYLDDLTGFSKDRENHLFHLKDVLERCCKHDISLNPKKSVFGVTEGKILGHIVSKKGIKVDPERVKSIQTLPLPSNKVVVHSLFGKVNFLWIFIPDFVEKTCHIVDMMKGKTSFHWNAEGKAAFNDIKDAIAHAPVLEKRNIKLKAVNFVLWDTGLYKRAIDGTFVRYIDKAQQTKLLESFHDKACGGHFYTPVISHKILRGYLYILTTTDYFTKWVEAISIKNATSEIVCRFLKENIISRFGVPYKILSDNVATFSSSKISQFFFEYSILLTQSSDYYPQDKITSKRAIGMSPFQLIYGINAEIPVTLELPALKLAKAIKDQTFENALDKRIMYLSQMEEQRTQVVDRITQHQQQVKVLFDKKAKQRGFQVGDHILIEGQQEIDIHEQSIDNSTFVLGVQTDEKVEINLSDEGKTEDDVGKVKVKTENSGP